jgi:hypothetical protein
MDNRRSKNKVLEMQSDPKILRQSFALLHAQWKCMLLLNLFWIIQAVPLFLALVFPTWPYGLRIGLSIYSVLALIPATATLFASLNQVSEGAQLSLSLVRQRLYQITATL